MGKINRTDAEIVEAVQGRHDLATAHRVAKLLKLNAAGCVPNRVVDAVEANFTERNNCVGERDWDDVENADVLYPAKKEAGYVQFEPADQMVFTRLRDGKIDLALYFTNEVSPSSGMCDAVVAWAEDTHPVIIAPHFTVASPVDYLIDGHEMPAYNHHISMDAKPIFDALKAELLEQVKRIDALVFESASQ